MFDIIYSVYVLVGRLRYEHHICHYCIIRQVFEIRNLVEQLFGWFISAVGSSSNDVLLITPLSQSLALYQAHALIMHTVRYLEGLFRQRRRIVHDAAQ